MFVTMLFILSVICAVFIILLVLVQDDQGEGMGGIFAGGSGSPFGSGSANVLQKGTAMMALFFFVTALGFAFLNKKSVVTPDLTEAGAWLSTFETTSSAVSADPEGLVVPAAEVGTVEE